MKWRWGWVLLLPTFSFATWSTPTQTVFNNACGAATSCAVTVSAIGVGHLLVVVAHTSNSVTLNSVTAAGETMSILSGCDTGKTGCAYTKSTVGGATTVTCNWSDTTSSTNTTCGVYEVPYTAQSIYLESNAQGATRTGPSTSMFGPDLTANYSYLLEGYSDAVFQLITTTTGTVSAINSSYTLANHVGRAGDAYILNTISNSTPTWTNSQSTSALVAVLSFGENFTQNTISALTSATGLSVSSTTNGLYVTVTSTNQFQLVFESSDNWGIAQWYDLVNDPTKATNLSGPAYPSGSNSPDTAEPGLFNRTYYDFSPGDTKLHSRSSWWYFPNSPRALNISEVSSARVVINTRNVPAVTASGVLNNLVGNTTYYIYPNGQIYIHHTSTFTNAVTITPGNLFTDITLEDPTKTTNPPPDTQGWIRASATQNPYTSNIATETYVYAYWGSGTSAPYTTFTKGSIMMVHSPNNLHDGNQIIHSWDSGAGHGVVRWGWKNNDPGDTISVSAGGGVTEDVMIQLGSQGSSVLPNLISSTVAGPYATAYITSPTPPDVVTSTSVVVPADPVVNQGATLQFIESHGYAGTWACSATNSTGGVTACSGNITSGGLYTAPSSVTAQHVYGGVQVGPNNEVYNTRIDSMPVHSSNTLYMATVNGIGNSPAWATDFPINYVLPTGSTASMNFHYTPLNNGTFEVPAYPYARAEHGWYSALQGNDSDHHVIMVDTVTGTFSEFYQYYPNCITTAASVASNVATLTCTENPVTNEFLVGSTVSVGGFTGSDTYFNVGTASITAVSATSISFRLVHANASASTNGHAGKNVTDPDGIWNSASGISYASMTYLLPTNNTTDAAGMQLQPMILGLQELERAVVTGGSINHAMRNTFAQGIEASSNVWPATTYATDGGTVPFGARMRLKSSFNIAPYSAPAQVLLTTLKRFGTINSDGGINYVMNAENTRWPQTYYDALDEMAAISLSSNMEFVNESSLMVSTSSSLTKANREIITFTRTLDGITKSVDLALMGPAVNFAKDAIYFMAGTTEQPIVVLNNYGGYSCSSASTGTLTSGCLYTPPATVSAATTTIITVTSLVNSSATARTRVTIYPSTGIYVIPSKTSDFTDSHGTKWVAQSGLSSLPDNQGCCACDNSASFGSFSNVELWNCVVGVSSTYGGDTHMDFVVPNGVYQVVYNYGTQGCCTGGQRLKLTVQNTEVYSNLDPVSSAGGQYKTFTSTSTSVTVTDNQLLIGIWNMNDLGAPISSLSIVQTSTELPAGPVTYKPILGTGTFEGTALIQ